MRECRRTVASISAHEPAPEQAHAARSGDAAARGAVTSVRFADAAGSTGAVVAVTAIVALAVAAAVGSTAAVVAYGSSCDLDSLRRALGANSFVFAADGSLLGSIPAERNRQPVSAADMSLWVRKATIAIQDRRFLEHGGVDLQESPGPQSPTSARARSSRAARRSRSSSSATSTSPVSAPSSARSRRPALPRSSTARGRSSASSPTYLNQVYDGNHAYGIEAAAQTYFSMPAQATSTLSQAALLAGLTQAPSNDDPFTAPGRALARRREVLDAMLDTRVITLRIYRKELAAKVVLHPGKLYNKIREPYFFGYVRDQLIQAYGAAPFAPAA